MENASFNSEQNTLTIPALSFSGQGSYFVEMHLSQTEPNVIFDVAKAEENGEVSSNEAYFSIDSGLLNIANLDIAGDSWIVTLEQLGSSSQFQVISASASPRVSVTEIVNSKVTPYVFDIGTSRIIPRVGFFGDLKSMEYLIAPGERVTLVFDVDGDIESIRLKNYLLHFSKFRDGESQVLVEGEAYQEFFAVNADASDIELIKDLFTDFNLNHRFTDFNLAGSRDYVEYDEERVTATNSGTLPSEEAVFNLLKAATLSTSVYSCAIVFSANGAELLDKSVCESSTLAYANLISRNDGIHNAEFAATVGSSASQCSLLGGPFDNCLDLITGAAGEILTRNLLYYAPDCYVYRSEEYGENNGGGASGSIIRTEYLKACFSGPGFY